MKFIEFRASVRLLIAFLALTASHIHAASFDCTKARSQVEHLVCDTPALSQQDETLAAIYKVALANDPAARQRQVTWLRETRDRCNDAPCLAVAYQTQIQAMGASPPAAMPAPVAQPNAAPSALQLACPPDWNALTDIDGPNPERVILGLKAREWRKEHIDMVLAKTQECQRSNSAPESVKKAGLVDICDDALVEAFMEHGVDVKQDVDCGDYLAKQDDSRKWGFAEELAKSTSKAGRAKGVHPHHFLVRRAEGDRDRYVEYVQAMKGRRQIFWSHGLKEKVGVVDATDEELATDAREAADVLGMLNADDWGVVRGNDARAELLDVVEGAEAHDRWPAVQRFLAALRI